MNAINTTFKRQAVPSFWLFISLLIFTACLGGRGSDDNTVTGAEVAIALGSQGTLVCSESCLQWGQCGSRVDGTGEVILAGRGGPLVASHELIFPTGTVVQVEGQDVRTLQPAVGGEMFEVPFYYVVTADATKGGWVAGWCVQPSVN